MKTPRKRSKRAARRNLEVTGRARKAAGDTHVPRRQFLKSAALAALGLRLTQWPGPMAGPFTLADFEKLVPADKKLQPDWVRSLFARGEPQVWRGAELGHIGMPIGGIGCGQLYLGGDGHLWSWNIFKPNYSTQAGAPAGPNYAKPLESRSEVEQGFALRVAAAGHTQVRPIDKQGFAEVSFRGEYPVARIAYRDPGCPVTVDVEAFSPFIPLDPESSSLPVSVLQFALKNTGSSAVELELAGWLQNAVCLSEDQPALGTRRNRVVRMDRVLVLDCSAEPPIPPSAAREQRPDIIFEDFEKETYEDWTVTGSAFGAGPIEKSKMPAYQGDVGAIGRRLVNSHNARQGEDVSRADAHVGTLTSKPFRIERDYITFLIGGGDHPGKTCLNLLVDGAVAASATGHNDNRMRLDCFEVSAWSGKTAQLQIVDQVRGPWGNIGIDQIVFTDVLPENKRLDQLPGFGTMTLSLLDQQESDHGAATLGANGSPAAVFEALGNSQSPQNTAAPFGQKLVGALSRKLALAPGQSANVTFALTWYFPSYPNPTGEMAALTDIRKLHRHYAKRFASASGVASFLSTHIDELAASTRLWNRTWYDSTLPYWFLDRTFLTIDTLATTTCHWFDNSRFYGWEGVDCCAGTCQHVWQYAQAMARIFPQLERDLRERVDFGLAWHPSGAMDYRAENGRMVAQDGFAGTILRAYREHQMSPDRAFLERLWPRIRKSLQFLMSQDTNQDGLLEGEQYNTLDASWFGPMAWISSLYLAALQAGRAMALEMSDAEFASNCQSLIEAGRQNIVAQLFNGEYFIHKPDPRHPEAINTNEGCHIDQLFGQSYAWQLGLERVVPQSQSADALRALWKYNFTPDIGPYRESFKVIPGGRWYAMPGEGGLLMCTWPKGGAEKAPGRGNPAFVGYFNECMTGFEYQVAAHMLWEGLATEGLAIARTIHDRYHASKRNPYNEVECSDHYSRAMMSYGVFLAACGFEYHGPKAHLGFAPRITPEKFRAAFTTAEGWGTFTQTRGPSTQHQQIEVKWGQLRLRTLAFALPAAATGRQVTATAAGREVPVASSKANGARLEISLAADLVLRAGQTLEVSITSS